MYKGARGEFYQVKFDLVVTFGAVVSFQFMYGDLVIGKQTSEYVMTDTTTAVPEESIQTTTLPKESIQTTAVPEMAIQRIHVISTLNL